jgi:hypothetical protein
MANRREIKMTTLFERDSRFTAARVRELHHITEAERLARATAVPGTRAESSAARHRWVLGPTAIAALVSKATRPA